MNHLDRSSDKTDTTPSGLQQLILVCDVVKRYLLLQACHILEYAWSLVGWYTWLVCVQPIGVFCRASQ